MPYAVTVESSTLTTITLLVQPSQPDCEPFSLAPSFALSLLVDPAHGPDSSGSWRPVGPLGEVFDEEAFDLLEDGSGEPEKYVSEVTVEPVKNWPWEYGMPDPVARYTVRVTIPRWLKHIGDLLDPRTGTGRPYAETGCYESHAYCSIGPYLN